MDAKRTLHVFDILYSMLLSSVSPLRSLHFFDQM